jgi:flagellar hook-associated protein 3 FlgL
MPLSTSLMFARSAQQMRAVQEQIDQTRTQIATGRQIVNASDDPTRGIAIASASSAVSRQQAFLDTVNSVSDRLDLQQEVIKSSQGSLSDLKTLALQAATGTMNASDRQSIAQQMEGIRATLATEANTRDTNGDFLFSGARLTTTPYPSASPDYAGDQTGLTVAVNEEYNLDTGRPATEVFTPVTRTDVSGSQTRASFFQSIDDMIAATRAGDLTGIQRGVGEMETLNEGMSAAMAKVGSAQAALSSQKSLIEHVQVQLKASLSRLQDADYTTVVTELQKESLSLQAAQQSFSQVSQLSLFNYIK